ncbi:hypothetical protein OU415_02530 [Saccharopolyspora sp. WRP15-2]|uniref:MarR family transcriptional regulator n=1 Tax=Saccharopolyspora oryzae TaxID=2997343 RepID=A0ABT4UT51_9PSEU|nr:hypothetical protein [Saccharopolyspora oryzae]MDA3624294.1 hypothetical protein [Saccharopolyspora oryzae]
MIAFTDERLAALSEVAEDHIVFHTVDSPIEGFRQVNGAALSLPELATLATLWRTQLIATQQPRTVCERATRRVTLTPAGHAALAEWRTHDAHHGRWAA